MSGLNISIIAEKINDSVPNTHHIFEAGDMDAIIELAKAQAAEGAAYIDVNIGKRPPELMKDLVEKIQDVVDVPLCIDSPDVDIQKAGVGAYKPEKAGGKAPLVNSISELRIELLELMEIQPVKYIVMCTERLVDGQRKPNDTAQEIYETARRLTAALKEKNPKITNDDLLCDPGMAPIGADTTGIVKASINAVALIHNDPDLAGIHMSVGLSNFTVQLPSKTASGDLVKTPLESAYLTICNPMGLDYIIGNTKKKYSKLEAGHPALKTVQDVINLDGFDCLMRVQEFYNA